MVASDFRKLKCCVCIVLSFIMTGCSGHSSWFFLWSCGLQTETSWSADLSASVKRSSPHTLYLVPCNTGVGTQVFQTRKNFSENYPEFEHALSKIFAGPVLGRKSLKNVFLKGPNLLAFPGRAHSSLWPALEGTRQIQVHLQWGSGLSSVTLYLLLMSFRFLDQYNWTCGWWKTASLK